MPIARINGVGINYVQIPCDQGADGEDLVMVHGLAASLAFWYLNNAFEFSKNYRVTLYDLRGHGRSEVPETGYAVGQMVDDLRGLLDYLGIERSHFAAHSFGGSVALSLACREPHRFSSLAIFDTHISAAREQHGGWKLGAKVQRMLEGNNIHLNVREPYFGYKLLGAIAEMKAKGKEVSDELEEFVRPLTTGIARNAAQRWIRLLNTTSAKEELMVGDGLSLEVLRQLNFPILAFYGEVSQAMATGEKLLDIWPHADFRIAREAGHFFPVTRPREFRECCQVFWERTVANGVQLREGDSGGRYFRSGRFYCKAGQWFFNTRESAENGPFEDLETAKSHFLKSISMHNHDFIEYDHRSCQGA